jgi:hypothetical protein
MTSNLLSLVALALVVAPAALAERATGGHVDAQAQTQAEAQVHAQARTPQARIDAAMEAAVRADVPVSLLTSKVAEGEAKRVPPERIAAAVEARLAALMRASGMLRRAEIDAQSAGELALMADALEAGVSESVVLRTWRIAPKERRVVALAVLADLVRLGQGSEPAFERVNAALRTNAALANLQAEVAARSRAIAAGSTR